MGGQIHKGTIIPESKLRRVHGWVDESSSFYFFTPVFVFPPVSVLRRSDALFHQTLSHTLSLTH